MKILLLVTTMAATFAAAQDQPQPNHELARLKRQYSGALDLLRVKLAEAKAATKAAEVAEVLRRADAGADLARVVAGSRWARSGDIGKDGTIFKFLPNGKIDCGAPSKFKRWAVDGEVITMGTDGYEVRFRMLADYTGMVARYGDVVIFFEALSPDSTDGVKP